MKKIVLVLILVLLSSLLFAQAGPDPLAEQAGFTNGDTNMYTDWYLWRWQGQLEPPFQYRLMAATGAADQEPAALQKGTQEEPHGLQARDRSGDCDGDCDGEPDQLQVQEKQKLQDGSCADGGDGPTRDQTRSGKK
jgi:hypothetical protein